MTGAEVAEILDTTEPRIVLGGGGGGGSGTGATGGGRYGRVDGGPSTMAPGDEGVVANRLYEVLSAKRALKATPAVKPPTRNCPASGRSKSSSPRARAPTPLRWLRTATG